MEKDGYINKLENEVINSLNKQVEKIISSLSKNKFDFISQCNGFADLGKANIQFVKFNGRAKSQIRAMREIAFYISEFEKFPITDVLKSKFLEVSSNLFEEAVKFGYCEPAKQFLKILSNKNLVGDYADSSQNKRVAKLLNAYGQRAIRESDGRLIKEDANQFIVDASMKMYGKVDFSVKEMTDIFKNTTYERAGVVFKPFDESTSKNMKK